MARRGNGVGQGTGWGGPARGAGTRAAKAPDFGLGNKAAARGHNLSRGQKRQELLDALFELAITAESQEVQVSAAVAWLNRVEGKPVAQAVQLSADDLAGLDDDALERKLRSHDGRS